MKTMAFYHVGTFTPALTFADAALTFPHTHPIVLAADGNPPAIYLSPEVEYEVEVDAPSWFSLMPRIRIYIGKPATGRYSQQPQVQAKGRAADAIDFDKTG